MNRKSTVPRRSNRLTFGQRRSFLPFFLSKFLFFSGVSLYDVSIFQPWPLSASITGCVSVCVCVCVFSPFLLPFLLGSAGYGKRGFFFFCVCYLLRNKKHEANKLKKKERKPDAVLFFNDRFDFLCRRFRLCPRSGQRVST